LHGRAGAAALTAGDIPAARAHLQAAAQTARQIGWESTNVPTVLGLACLAGDAGDWDQAAALHGVAQAFQDRTGNPWQEPGARYRRDSLDQARAPGR
jgi:hypothetical protein